MNVSNFNNLQEENGSENLVFVLLKIPFEKCLEVAERIKYKMPIEVNYIYEERLSTSILNTLYYFSSYDSSNQKYTKYFTAPYASNLREK